MSADTVIAGSEVFPFPSAIPASVEVIPVQTGPSVRAARPGDIDAIVGIEVGAYHDVYGVDPAADTVDDLRQKNVDRIELLGDLVRVLEHPDRGVYGVMVCCTTNLGKDDFLAENRDMTSSDTIRDIYDPNGKNAYIVNLAILPKYQGGERFNLLADALRIGAERGVEKAYFESRLPGFEHWVESWTVQRYCEIVEESGSPRPTMHDLVQVYWQAKETARTGVAEKPLDPLLRMYVDLGATPLRLVEDAWKPDKSSRGFGVLCEYDLIKDASTPTPQAEVLEPVRKGGILEWVKSHQKLLALGAVVLAAGGYVASQGGLDETLASIKEAPRFILRSYLGSLAAFGAGLALMGVGAAREIRWSNFKKHPITEIREAALRTPNSRMVRAGFWLNWAAAVSADTALFAGIAETSQNLTAALVASTVPAADLVQGAAMRAPFVRSMTRR